MKSCMITQREAVGNSTLSAAVSTRVLNQFPRQIRRFYWSNVRFLFLKLTNGEWVKMARIDELIKQPWFWQFVFLFFVCLFYFFVVYFFIILFLFFYRHRHWIAKAKLKTSLTPKHKGGRDTQKNKKNRDRERERGDEKKTKEKMLFSHFPISI